jgi:hypothetical protein
MSLKKLVESANQKLDEFNIEYMDPRDIDNFDPDEMATSNYGKYEKTLTPDIIKKLQGSSGQAVKDYVDQLLRSGYTIPPEVLSQLTIPESTNKGELGQMIESQRYDDMLTKVNTERGGCRKCGGELTREPGSAVVFACQKCNNSYWAKGVDNLIDLSPNN